MTAEAVDEIKRKVYDTINQVEPDLEVHIEEITGGLNSLAIKASAISYNQHDQPGGDSNLQVSERQRRALEEDRLALEAGSQRVPGNFAISAELVELTCLAGITQQMVLAFSSGATSREVRLEKGIFRYDVLANAEDFLDTWGPGYFIHSKANPSKIHAIAIGDGFVTLVDSKTSRFHWAKGALPESALQVAFEPYSMMRIGAAVSINNDCCIDEAAYRKSSFCALEPLGTHEAFWEAQERQAGSSAAAITPCAPGDAETLYFRVLILPPRLKM